MKSSPKISTSEADFRSVLLRKVLLLLKLCAMQMSDKCLDTRAMFLHVFLTYQSDMTDSFRSVRSEITSLCLFCTISTEN